MIFVSIQVDCQLCSLCAGCAQVACQMNMTQASLSSWSMPSTARRLRANCVDCQQFSPLTGDNILPMYLYLFIYLPCVLCFLGILEDLGGSGRVWQLIVVLPGARQKCSVPKGLEWGMSFYVLLLDLMYSLELLENSLAYKPFCYYIYALVCREYPGNIIYTCTSKQLVSCWAVTAKKQHMAY